MCKFTFVRATSARNLLLKKGGYFCVYDSILEIVHYGRYTVVKTTTFSIYWPFL